MIARNSDGVIVLAKDSENKAIVAFATGSEVVADAVFEEITHHTSGVHFLQQQDYLHSLIYKEFSYTAQNGSAIEGEMKEFASTMRNAVRMRHRLPLGRISV